MTFIDQDGFKRKIIFYREDSSLGRKTFCKILHEWIKPSGESVWVESGTMGSSRCHPQDNFCKETGRKIALERALRLWPKEFRRLAWNAYFGRSR